MKNNIVNQLILSIACAISQPVFSADARDIETSNQEPPTQKKGQKRKASDEPGSPQAPKRAKVEEAKSFLSLPDEVQLCIFEQLIDVSRADSNSLNGVCELLRIARTCTKFRDIIMGDQNALIPFRWQQFLSRHQEDMSVLRGDSASPASNKARNRQIFALLDQAKEMPDASKKEVDSFVQLFDWHLKRANDANQLEIFHKGGRLVRRNDVIQSDNDNGAPFMIAVGENCVERPLHRAARYGNCMAVRLLLDYGADANAKLMRLEPRFPENGPPTLRPIEDQYSAVSLATIYNQPMARKLILDNERYSASKDNVALMIALHKKDEDLARALVRKGASRSVALSEARKRDCKTFALEIFREQRDFEESKENLCYVASLAPEEFAEWLSQKASERQSFCTRAIYLALLIDNESLALSLISKSEDLPYDLKNAVKRSELSSCVLSALKAGFGLEPNDGKILLWALRKASVHMVLWLLDNDVFLHVQDMCGFTPLHNVCHRGENSGSIQIINRLLEAGLAVDVLTDDNQETALHVAAHFGNAELVEGFLEAGANINARSNIGQTPLHYAVGGHPHEDSSDLNVTRILLEHGAEVNALDNQQRPPLWAALITDENCFAALLAANANIHAKDDQNNTMLHWVADVFYPLIDETLRMMQILVDKGLDVNATNNDGDTPLHIAAMRNNLKAAEFFIGHNALVNARNSEGKTPAQIAEENGHSEFIALLQ